MCLFRCTLWIIFTSLLAPPAEVNFALSKGSDFHVKD